MVCGVPNYAFGLPNETFGMPQVLHGTLEKGFGVPINVYCVLQGVCGWPVWVYGVPYVKRTNFCTRIGRARIRPLHISTKLVALGRESWEVPT